MITTQIEDTKTLLVELTAELKLLGLWQTKQPSIVELSSRLPFCCDTLLFEQWLQFIFIPKLTMMIMQQQALPTKISLLPMAEEAFMHLPLNTNSLLGIIQQIDKTLTR